MHCYKRSFAQNSISFYSLCFREIVVGNEIELTSKQHHVQYCAKVTPMKFDEVRSLFSRNFAQTLSQSFVQCQAKLQAKIRPLNEISWKCTIFRKVKQKITLAKICKGENLWQ